MHKEGQLSFGGLFSNTDPKIDTTAQRAENNKSAEIEKKVIQAKLPNVKYIKEGDVKGYFTRKGFSRIIFLSDSLVEARRTKIDNRKKTVCIALTPTVIKRSNPENTYTFTIKPGQSVFSHPRLRPLPKREIPTAIEALSKLIN